MTAGCRDAKLTPLVRSPQADQIVKSVSDAVSLADHVRAHGGPDAASLAVVLAHLARAGRVITSELSRAALVGQLGKTRSPIG